MDFKLLRLAALEITISLLMGVVILYLTYRGLVRILHRRGVEDHQNTAFAVFTAAVLASVGIIVSGSIEPLLTTFRFLTAADDNSLLVLAKFAGYLAGFFVLTSLLALVVNVCGVSLFCRLTKVDEFEEIRKNNVAVALVTAAIILTITVFVRGGVVLLLESAVPYPAVPGVR